MCGGGSQPSTQTVVQKNEIPQYLQDFGQENINVARSLGERGFPVYPGQRIADTSQFTTQAQGVQSQQYNNFNNANNAYQGVIDYLRGQLGSQYAQPGAAQQTAANATAGTYGQPLPGVQQATTNAYGQALPGVQQATSSSYGSQLTPGSIAPWMSPFVELALQPQLRAAQRQGAASGRTIQGQAAAAGAFGDARTGVEMGENTRNTNTLLSDITGQGYQSAYDRAVQAAQNAFGQNTGQFNTEQAAARAAAQQNNQANLAQWAAGAGQFNTETDARLKALLQNNTANLAQYQAGAQQFNTEDAARRAAIELNSRVTALNNAANLDVYKAGASQYNTDRAAQLATAQGIQSGLSNQQQYAGELMKQLYVSGQTDEAARQRPLDLAYQDFINQFEYPIEQLNTRLAAGQGVPYSTTRLTTTPYSATGQAVGTLASLYGLIGKTAGGTGNTTDDLLRKLIAQSGGTT